jgi:hypothetical protein
MRERERERHVRNLGTVTADKDGMDSVSIEDSLIIGWVQWLKPVLSPSY